MQDACAFRERLLRNRVRSTPLIVCLDGERLPPEGAVFAGQRCLASPDTSNVFGKSSATESTEYAILQALQADLEDCGKPVDSPIVAPPLTKFHT